MQKVINKLVFLILVLFSLPGFSQSDSSKHPLLDKYYPSPKVDTVATNPVIKRPEIQRQGETPVPARMPQVIAEKKAAPPAAVPVATPPPPETPPVVAPPVTSAVTQPVNVTESKPMAVISDTLQIKRPALPVTTATPPVKAAATKRDPNYRYGRLGSSSPLYRTYESNSNGAGSVTTRPKG